MQFLARLTQFGEGCDYTIACGQKTVRFEADDSLAAIKYIENLVRDEYAYEEGRLENVELFHVSYELNFDVTALYSAIDSGEEDAAALKEVQRAEEALARAKAKLRR